jgi:hypothetical protein
MGTDDFAWRIDAIDGLGGLAFVSWRPMDLIIGQANLDLPSYAITAPDFRPEPLSSRAVGFAATRRGFQLGVWSGDEELSFATLEAVSQFVMRIYIIAAGRGGSGGTTPRPEGGGRGGGGGGERPPERPLEPSKDHKATFEDQQTFVKFSQEIFSHFKLFITHDAEFSRSNFKSVDWRMTTGLSTPSTDTRLQYGALALCLEEVLARWIPSSDPFPEQWMRSLAEVLRLAEWIAGYDTCRQLLLECRNRYERKPTLAHLLSQLRDFWDYHHWRRVGGVDDPILTLRQIPLSRDIAERFGHEAPDRASLLDGLQIMLADPSVAARTDDRDFGECLALLFLAARVIVSMAAGRSSALLWDWPRPPSMPHRQLAWHWLANQLPAGPFPQRVEEIIRTVRSAGSGLTPHPSAATRQAGGGVALAE